MIRGDLEKKSNKELLNDWRLLWMQLERQAISPEKKIEFSLLARKYFAELVDRGFHPNLPDTLKPMTYIHDAVIQVGSSVINPEEANDIDILIRFPFPLKDLEEHLEGIIRSQGQDKAVHFLYEPLGPDRSYKVLGDLILYPFELRIIPSMDNVKILGPFVWTDYQSLYIEHKTPGIAIKLTRLFGLPVLEGTAGSDIDNILYYLAFLPRDEQTVALESLKLFEPIQPLKSQTGYGEFTFYDTEKFWEFYGQENLPFYMEPKVDGLRLMIHSDGNRVAIYTEDRKRERSQYLPELVEDVKKLNAEVILDGECIIPGETRANMIKIVTSTEPVTGVQFYVFDVIYLNGKDLTELPFEERRKILENLFDSLDSDRLLSLRLIPSYRIADKDDFVKFLDDCLEFPHSEGFMAKTADGKYSLTGRTQSWAKCKLFHEVKAMVIGIHRQATESVKGHKPVSGEEAVKLYKQAAKHSQTYILRCAMYSPEGKLVPIESKHKLTKDDIEVRYDGEKWHGLESPELWDMDPEFGHRYEGEYAYGNTYARKLPVRPQFGDIVTIRVKELRRFVKDDGSIGYSWENPILYEQDPERTEPDKIAIEARELDYSDTAPKEEITSKLFYITTTKPVPAVMQIHVRGIYDSESRELLIERLMKSDNPSEIWKEENLFWIKSMSALLDDARKTEIAGGDVTAAINRHISTRYITDIENTWNKGNAHIDFRIKHPEEDYLIGWTIDQPKIALQNVGTGEIIFPLGFTVFEVIGSMTITEKKPPQPLGWLTLVTKDHPVFEAPPAGVGATAKAGARFQWLASFELAAGVCKPYFFEYFVKLVDKKSTGLQIMSRLFSDWRRMDFKKPDNQPYWFFSLPKQNEPYILTHEKDQKDVLWNDNVLELIGRKNAESIDSGSQTADNSDSALSG